MNEPRIVLPPLCQTHRYLLVHQAGFTPSDPWRVLEIAASVALFQAASADPKVQDECDGDITAIGKLGCMACRKPDAFGEVVEAAKTHRIGAVKALGEKWVHGATKGD